MSGFSEQAFDFLEGELLLIDKPAQWTSFDVVNKIRYILQRQLNRKRIKVGHAGTLDPLATGLLLICTGKMTKKISELQDMQKQYTGKFFLGATTPSFDLESEIDKKYPTDHITEKDILEASRAFEGKITQTPPAFSAVKIKGVRAYKLAREDQEVKIKAREVYIESFKIDKLDLPEIEFTVDCSKGTYIRTLAHDFGQKLKSGAYLKELRRTKIGGYDVSDALSIEQIEFIIRSLPQQNT